MPSFSHSYVLATGRSPRSRASIVVVALGVLLAGCNSSSSSRNERTTGSAVWLEADSGNVSNEILKDLSDAGAPEVFLRASTISWQRGGLDFQRVNELDAPRRVPLTLALSGEAPGPDNPADQAERLSDELLQLKLDAETRGWSLRGFHLDLSLNEVEGFGDFLAQLRDRIDDRLSLSIRLPESWLDLEPKELEQVLAPIDFYTLRVFGQTIGQEQGRPDRWEIEKAIERSLHAASIGKPFLAEILTIGWVERLDASGEKRDRAFGVALQDLMKNRNFTVEPIFAFSGFDRQVFELKAKRSGRLGGLRIREGETLRIVRPTAAHLARLRSGLLALQEPTLMGELYRAWPKPLQTLSVGPQAIALALKGDTIAQLEVSAEQVKSGALTQMRFTLRNTGLVTTSIAIAEANYLEVQVDEASFGAVRTGDFHRYKLGRRGDSEDIIQSVRNADQARLYFPMLDPGWSVTTGLIDIYTSQNSVIRVGANYLLPDGANSVLEPVDWNEVELGRAKETTEANESASSP